ncbi:TonB-dependent receptor, partial [Chromohalobacter sp. 296-RDG]|uniref:TonB-dependent receptor n=1 Tax=Chromohalobacter sp. 296-RDG TaxID=2994062 RepID=UPI002469A104
LPTHQVYANISTSFETPTFSEFANPSEAGGFNPSVEPQKAWSREIGADAGSECNTVNVSMTELHGTSPAARSSPQWDT